MYSVQSNNNYTLSEEPAKGNLRQQGIVKYLDGNRINEVFFCNNWILIQVFVNDTKVEYIV